MSRESTLEWGRAAAEAGMPDTCQIGFEVQGTTIDEGTGTYPTIFTPIYDGPCEFMAPHRVGQDVDAAGQIQTDQSAVLKLPVLTSAGVEKNMVAKFTASLNDPGMVGMRARITAPFVGSYTTARRFYVEVVS